MANLGWPVVYRADEKHYTTTIVGQKPAVDAEGREIAGKFEPVTAAGSVHHRELREFAAQVTRAHDDGSYSLVLFPPGHPPVHVEHVREGDGPGTFGLIAPPAPAGESGKGTRH